MTFILVLIIMLRIINTLIIFDIILSWLSILGINYRPKFLAQTLNPLYNSIKNIFPTTIGPLDFTPIIIIFITAFIEGAIFLIFPEYKGYISYMIN